MTPDAALDTLRHLIAARSRDHGGASVLDLTAAFWQRYMANRTHPLAAADVCRLLALHKIARAACGESLEDHDLDGAGYLLLALNARPAPPAADPLLPVAGTTYDHHR